MIFKVIGMTKALNIRHSNSSYISDTLGLDTARISEMSVSQNSILKQLELS